MGVQSPKFQTYVSIIYKNTGISILAPSNMKLIVQNVACQDAQPIYMRFAQ